MKWNAWGNDEKEDKFIILDTPSDGGLRMDSQASSYSSLVEQLLLDPRIPNDEMRCEFLQKALDSNWIIDNKILNSGFCNGFN